MMNKVTQKIENITKSLNSVLRVFDCLKTYLPHNKRIIKIHECQFVTSRGSSFGQDWQSTNDISVKIPSNKKVANLVWQVLCAKHWAKAYFMRESYRLLDAWPRVSSETSGQI